MCSCVCAWFQVSAIKTVCACVRVCFPACEGCVGVRAFVTIREHIQMVPLSVFPGSLVLQVTSKGGIVTFLCVCLDIIERVSRETCV